ncbi:MAG: methyltransferase [Anaerolineales bacterium]|nr:methyltransferase [Anaerolineales bacterium]
MNTKRAQKFQFQQFAIRQERCGFKVGTDGVLLGAWADVAGRQRALDIGTGTGLLALMLAQRNPALRVDAVELEADAAAQAAENGAASPWGERVRVWQTAVQDFHPTTRYDLIVSNPPFFAADQHLAAPDLARRQARQTATLSFADLLDSVVRLLGENGRFCLILPVAAGREFVQLAGERGLWCGRETAVFPTPSKPAHRLLLELGWEKHEPVYDRLTIETEQHHVYTRAFGGLTANFYVKQTGIAEESDESII